MQILDVKQQITKKVQLPPQNQKIIYKSKPIQNEVILAEIGAKQEDNFVLMKIIKTNSSKKKDNLTVERQKQSKKNSQGEPNNDSKQKQKQLQIQVDEGKLSKLMKLGYRKSTSQKALKNNNNDIQKSIEEILQNKKNQGEEISINEILRQEIKKNLEENKEILEMTQNGEIKFAGDLQGLTSILAQKNESLQKILLQNPSQLLELWKQLGNDFEPQQQAQMEQAQMEQGQEQQYVADVTFTESEEQAIQRLMGLGFKKQQVVPAYLACEKNQQLAADMLFNQKQNGDFDDQ